MKRAARRGRGARARRRRPRLVAAPPTIDARVDQANPRFGDSFGYVVTATVDGSLVGGARIVQRRRTVHAARRRRSSGDRSSNGVGHITVTETIACLSAACLEERRRSRRPAAAPASRPGGEVAVAPRVEVTVGSRVSRSGREGVGAGRSGGPAACRARPTASRPSVAATRARAPRRRPPRRRRGRAHRLRSADRVPIGAGRSTSTSAERAVRLLRESATRDAADRRRAASLASRVVGEPELARTAAGVAWSRPEPGPPDATTLADRVEHAAGGRA